MSFVRKGKIQFPVPSYRSVRNFNFRFVRYKTPNKQRQIERRVKRFAVEPEKQ